MQTEEQILPETELNLVTPGCQDEEYEEVYHKPHTLVDVSMHYCPGCAHSLVHKLLMEVVEEMDIQDKTIGIAPVGCSVFAYDYLDIDMQEAAHGRACAVATAIKRLMPDKYVFTYQGDGDLAAIGIGETLHAINRGENILIVFINNAVYGMTSGQMAGHTMAFAKPRMATNITLVFPDVSKIQILKISPRTEDQTSAIRWEIIFGISMIPRL